MSTPTPPPNPTPTPAKPKRKRASSAQGQVSRSTTQILAAAGVVLLFVVAAACILVATDGRFNKGYAVAFFVVIALIAGTSFWAFTPTHDKWSRFSDGKIRLAGGAAIGMIFAIAGWKIVEEDNAYVVAELPQWISNKALRARPGAGLMEAEAFPGTQRKLLYARFAPECTMQATSCSAICTCEAPCFGLSTQPTSARRMEGHANWGILDRSSKWPAGAHAVTKSELALRVSVLGFAIVGYQDKRLPMSEYAAVLEQAPTGACNESNLEKAL